MREARDLARVCGQESGKRALEIAAAGGHPLLLVGPARTGKTLLARCVAGILAEPVEERFLDSGASPGEIQDAFGLEKAVVVIEELPRLRPTSLAVFRAVAAGRRPSLLILATTRLCACGRHLDQAEGCLCTRAELARHASRFSAVEAIFHLRVRLGTVPLADLMRSPMEPSADVAGRVAAARRRQLDRGEVNAACATPRIDDCANPELAVRFLDQARRGIIFREDDLLRVARTIADLAGRMEIEIAHLAEAICYGQLGGDSEQNIYSISSIKA